MGRRTVDVKRLDAGDGVAIVDGGGRRQPHAEGELPGGRDQDLDGRAHGDELACVCEQGRRDVRGRVTAAREVPTPEQPARAASERLVIGAVPISS